MATLDASAKALVDMVAASGAPEMDQMSPAEARAAMGPGVSAMIPPTPPIQIRDVAAQGRHGKIPMRVYRPQGVAESEALPGLIYIHGGGWVLGEVVHYDPLCATLANGARAVVISLDYRLAPEHKFPAAVDDCVDATDWIFSHAKELGLDPARVAVGGDSAGGNLTAVVCLSAAEKKWPKIKGQLLLYPVTDAGFAHPSYVSNATGYFLTTAAMKWFRSHYLRNDEDIADWRVSPLRAKSLKGQPPAYVITCGFDPLRDEGDAYAERLKKDGVPTVFKHYPGQIHGFVALGGVLPEAGPAVAELTEQLKKFLAA